MDTYCNFDFIWSAFDMIWPSQQRHLQNSHVLSCAWSSLEGRSSRGRETPGRGTSATPRGAHSASAMQRGEMTNKLNRTPVNRYDLTSRMLMICTSLFPICFRNPISTNVSTKLREMIIWLLGSVFLSLSCECLTNPYKSCWCMLLNYWMCTMHLFCRVRKMHFWVGNGASNPSISVVPTASPCPSPCSMIFPGRSGDRPCTGKIPQAFIQFILWWCSWPSWLSWLSD